MLEHNCKILHNLVYTVFIIKLMLTSITNNVMYTFFIVLSVMISSILFFQITISDMSIITSKIRKYDILQNLKQGFLDCKTLPAII